ncbi:GNAT family N-acetyltransferase [Flectobacillus major]|jgi:GNAT superfamily N-acetyltransferase|uniref:GNAT family N-acetyltransferase n=1 Tax=Flectobacillus major TaxID=103 RepID=UPI00041BA168|nr:GNAT family N-acetyltransferase [Flectobacillus major]
MQVKLVENEQDLQRCFEVLKALRPHLDLAQFITLYTQMQQESYQIAFVEEDDNTVLSAIGFRFMTMLYTGKIIYIDDLSTLPASRGQGRASLLLDYVIDLAENNGCNAVHLDSGHHRHDAHRLYLQKRFKIASHHFSLDIPRKEPQL